MKVNDAFFCGTAFVLSIVFAVLRLVSRANGFILLFCQFLLFVAAVYLLLGCMMRRGVAVKASKILRIVILSGVGLFVVSFTVIVSLVLLNSRSDDVKGVKYVLVAGAGVNGSEPSTSLKRRLDAAYEILSDDPDTVAILCGGYTQGDAISECGAMSNYLSARGISGDRLIQEPDSHDTAQNIMNAKKIIDSIEGQSEHEVVIVSSYYHVYRCGLLAERYGLKARTVSAEFNIDEWPFLVREYFSFLIYLIESTGITVDTSALGI